jgi:glyoxylase-like metal-dependent hydrolase (beta-lactamase superfamily II)
MAFDVKAFFDPATSTVTYLVWDQVTGEAAVIDPVLDYEPRAAKVSTTSAETILKAATERRLTVKWILETHAHADHLSAADHLRRVTGAKVAIGEKITEVQARFGEIFGARDVVPDGRAFDRLVADGDELRLGATLIKAMHTPGHTPGCVTYLIGDAAFVGDTLFMPDYGTARADFPGGDASALYRSIRRILSLPPDTRIFVGHDYLPEGRDRPAWETTVSEQRARNVHIHEGVSECEFVALRNARDATLAPPTLILPSLQVNIRAGAMPPPENDGRVYLKLPVTDGIAG